MELKIKEIMQERGLTSISLSEKVGISRVALSNIITGKSSPSLENTAKIAEALHVSVSYLIGETDQNTREEISEGGSVLVCPHCGKPFKVCVQASEE